MDNSRNRNNEHLGINKMGKNIRKSPLHQPNFANNNNGNNGNQAAARQQPQPQVYNISKTDFRNIVQQLTGSPSHSQDHLPRPPSHNPPKPQSMRLQRIRPPPLAPINRPHMPAPAPPPAFAQQPLPYNNNLARPPQFGQPSPTPMRPFTPGDGSWPNVAESPISAYMRYLQNSMMDAGPRGNQFQQHLPPPQQHLPPPQQHLPPPQQQGPGQMQGQPPSSVGLLPMPGLPAPRMSGPAPPMPNLPSPRMNGPALLPSPTSQFLLPSPTGYMNLLSPRSPYPLLSPRMQYPPPWTPTFAFSPMGGQSGILGPGPQPPLSPGLGFPLSPSGFFPISSPRWRDF